MGDRQRNAALQILRFTGPAEINYWRLEKDPELKTNYIKTVHDDLQKGYLIPVGEFNPECRSSRHWYLPHHPVVNPNKPGIARRVLNGASKFYGKSLISCLLTGPDLLQDQLNSSFASGSISMQSSQILKECSFRSVCLLQIKLVCVFL